MTNPCLSYSCEMERRELHAQLLVAQQRIHNLDRLARSLEARLAQVTAANRAHDTNDGRFHSAADEIRPPGPDPRRMSRRVQPDPDDQDNATNRIASLFRRRTS